jgi:hypothetical protein
VHVRSAETGAEMLALTGHCRRIWSMCTFTDVRCVGGGGLGCDNEEACWGGGVLGYALCVCRLLRSRRHRGGTVLVCKIDEVSFLMGFSSLG